MKLPRLLALAAALSVFATLSTPAGGASGARETCGLPIAIQDPDIRATFARFEQNQSPAATKACASFRKDASGAL